MAAKRGAKHFSLIFIVLLITSESPVLPKTILNKCCPFDESLNGFFQCNKSKAMDRDDQVWWVPKSANESDNDYLNLLDGKSTSDGWLNQKPCTGEQERFLHGFHFNLKKFGNDIVLDVVEESTFHDVDNPPTHEIPSKSFCVDWIDGVKRHAAVLCPCQARRCVRKCCPDNTTYNFTGGQKFAMFQKSYCVPTEGDILPYWLPEVDNSTSSSLDYYRLVDTPPICERHGHIIVNKSASGGKRLFLNQDGSIQVGARRYAENKYCGEYTVDGDELLLMCLSTASKNMTVYGILFVIGAVALFLAIFLAVILPDMRRNIHGKMTLAHNVMLFIGFITLGIIMIKGKYNDMSVSSCKATSFIIQFSVLSAFFWLNVMCIDIAWVFSGLRPIRGSASQRDYKKLIYYSLYAWGSTSVIVGATAIVEFKMDVSMFKPNFGLDGGSCYFNNRMAMLAFFYGPIAALLVANLSLFLYTAAKIIAIKRETSILQSKDSSSNKKNTQRLILYGKLFFLMGVTWMFEVISWATQSTNSFFVFTDLLNLLRGVFIFVIFCCKRKVYYQTRNKVYRLFGKEVLEKGYSTRGSARDYNTNSSTMSRTTVPVTPVAAHRVTFNRQGSKLSIELNKL